MLHPLFAEGEHLAFLPEVVALLLSCMVIVYLCQRIHLVPIVAFLLTGVLIGPNALGLVREAERVNTLAEVGVMLLLFTIGMEFSLDELIRLMRSHSHRRRYSGRPDDCPCHSRTGVVRYQLASGRLYRLFARAEQRRLA